MNHRKESSKDRSWLYLRKNFLSDCFFQRGWPELGAESLGLCEAGSISYGRLGQSHTESARDNSAETTGTNREDGRGAKPQEPDR